MPDLKLRVHLCRVVRPYSSESRISPMRRRGLKAVGLRSLSRVLAVSLVCGGITTLLTAQSVPGAPASIPGYDTLMRPQAATSPLAQPALSPGVLMLMELEGRFAQSVAVGGGKAFASWFADDAVTLNNGRPAVLGRAAIAADANWDPKVYQLTWTPQGAQLGPSGDMGFTWGHYEGRSTDRNGQPVVTSGRYFTVWKKTPDGTWKVALDASANEPAASGECCSLPKP